MSAGSPRRSNAPPQGPCLSLVWPQLLKNSSPPLISPLTWPTTPYVTLQDVHARYCADVYFSIFHFSVADKKTNEEGYILILNRISISLGMFWMQLLVEIFAGYIAFFYDLENTSTGGGTPPSPSQGGTEEG